MKIVFTGGGSGGHFYPIIAIAEALEDIVEKKNLIKPALYYMGPTPYDERLLFEHEIQYLQAPAGKMRMYSDIKNVFDYFRTFIGVVKSIFVLWSIFPDVVVSKGGYASFPTTVAAWLLGIPIFVHDSDAIPGRANIWAGQHARAVAVSYPEAAEYFQKKEVVVFTGNPVRKELQHAAREGGHDFFKLQPLLKTILVLGGSQGATFLNDVILEALPLIVNDYQIIHQTGTANEQEVSSTANVILENNPHKNRYYPVGYLNAAALKMAAGAADLVVSRAGSGSIFEIAAWGKPSILIPIPKDISRDQHTNAFAYARTGAATVIEQNNFTPHVLIAELHRILDNPGIYEALAKAASNFGKKDAAQKIAEKIVALVIEHE